LSKRILAKVAKVATPLLQDGEQLEQASQAAVSQISIKGGGTAVALAGLGGALGAASVQYFVALTNRRLLFFRVTAVGNRPKNEASVILARETLTTSPVKGWIRATFKLHVAGEEKGYGLVFGVQNRGDARLLAAALPSTAQSPAGKQ
jgi:hypothetical protein